MGNDGWFDDEPEKPGLESMLPKTPVVEAPRVLKCPATGKDAVFLVDRVFYSPNYSDDGCLTVTTKYMCSISRESHCNACSLYTKSTEAEGKTK